jgi:hypothetical protein
MPARHLQPFVNQAATLTRFGFLEGGEEAYIVEVAVNAGAETPKVTQAVFMFVAVGPDRRPWAVQPLPSGPSG